MAFSPNAHVVLFPFMSKGHTIPLLDLARLLHRRHVTVTIFTTPANLLFLSNALVSLPSISFISLSFPTPIQGLPEDVESTDALPSMSLFPLFASATSLLRTQFEDSLSRLIPKPTLLISDTFLGWTLSSASKFNIPRFAFSGMSNQTETLYHLMRTNRHLEKASSDEEVVSVTEFPWLKLSPNDFDSSFTSRNSNGCINVLLKENFVALAKSNGLISNSFYELERCYVDYWNSGSRPKSWCIGPLCLAEPVKVENQSCNKPSWIRWLDEKHEQGRSVLYIAFGSQEELSQEQLKEIEVGLEKSEVNFLWVTRKNNLGRGNEFEKRVKDKGLIVTDWVDQREILVHESVQGFLSHCGWNSILESICAKVPILAWPMMAEQPLNAKMVVEEIKVGLRVETCDGSVRGFVKYEGLVKMIKELMEGDMGKEARKRVREIGATATSAIEEGGSSWHMLSNLIDEMSARELRMQ